uniref:hypothetical protein n=1 Tax=Klebsiella pneumoniae TaxID=573 RepID=UPI001C8F6F58
MSSLPELESSVQDSNDDGTEVKLESEEQERTDFKDDISEFITFDMKTDLETLHKVNLKRKRKVEGEETTFVLITEVFLRIIYPLSRCMNK